MIIQKIFILTSLLLSTLFAIEQSNIKANTFLGIEEVPYSLGDDYVNNFKNYTKVVAPNGKPIHIVAQNKITTEQIIRTRSILEHYLKDYPDSVYGNDKSAVANQMAKNNAILLLLNGSDDDTNPASNLEGQPLYQNEIQVEGHKWYINQNYEHRDATFEEILHLVHDTGIGVDGENSQAGVLPKFQTQIRAAQQNAFKNDLWIINNDDIINELSEENSLSQEYLASVIDSYYGLWGAWEESATHGMGGIYISKTRGEISKEDTMGGELLNNKFFHPYLTYNARIDSSFQGTFSLKFDTSLPYTYHSQYLKDITLLGDNNTNIKVNELDNNITGNTGENRVIFSGLHSQYTIKTTSNITTVTHSIKEGDGKNTLQKIEKLQFVDKNIQLNNSF